MAKGFLDTVAARKSSRGFSQEVLVVHGLVPHNHNQWILVSNSLHLSLLYLFHYGTQCCTAFVTENGIEHVLPV